MLECSDVTQQYLGKSVINGMMVKLLYSEFEMCFAGVLRRNTSRTWENQLSNSDKFSVFFNVV